MLLKHCGFILAYLLATTQSENDETNYGNLYRYMSLPPSDLNRLVYLLQEPKFTRALVNGDAALKTNPRTPPPHYSGEEEDRKLIYYLLGYTRGPHEMYSGGFAERKALKRGMARGFNHVYKVWPGADGFPDRRGDYEVMSPNDKLVPTLL